MGIENLLAQFDCALRLGLWSIWPPRKDRQRVETLPSKAVALAL
jgi:hypothetical protein